MSAVISAESLYSVLGLPEAPVLLDLCPDAERGRERRALPGAILRDPAHADEWVNSLPPAFDLVCYGVDDRPIERGVVDAVLRAGCAVRTLTGGLEGWMRAGYATVRVREEYRATGGSRWITRERPKIDRLACPWLIRRFIDREAQFFYTAPHRVREEARTLGGEPYDIADVTFSHRGPRCSFDAFLDEFDLHDPVLDEVATIVRAADTGALTQSREAPGLLALSLGLSAYIADDLLLLEQAMPLYDALYAWRKRASHETHAWPQTTS